MINLEKKVSLKKKAHCVYLVNEIGVGCIGVFSTFERARKYIGELSQYYDTNDAWSIDVKVVNKL